MLDHADVPKAEEATGGRPGSLIVRAIEFEAAGNHEAARTLMREATRLAPEWDEPWLRLGQNLRNAERATEAVDAYDHALALNPRRIEALLSRGVLALQDKQPHEAVDFLIRATRQSPGNHQVWHALGCAFTALGLAGAALDAVARAGRIMPDSVVYSFAYDDIVRHIGTSRAEVVEQPAWNEAVELALEGRAALRSGEASRASEYLEAAVMLQADDAALLSLLGTTYLFSHQPEKAEPALRAAHRMAPHDMGIVNDLAVALGRLYRFGEAAALMNMPQITAHLPPTILFNRATLRAAMGDLAGSQADIEAARDGADLRAILHTECTLLPYRSGTTAVTLRNAMERLAATLPDNESPVMRLLPPEPDRPLRIGLLSHSLRQHPVGWLTFAGLEALDPTIFSLVCFGHFTPGDAFASRLADHVGGWHEITGKSEREVAEMIAGEEIDILIDLGGFGDNGQIAALAYRPAPVQIKWVGTQASTTGMKAIDWFITDRWETPDGFETFYTERLLRLPDGYVCYRPPSHPAEVGPLPAQDNGYVTFGCFNNLAKLTDSTLALWARVLERVDRARLILRCPQFSEAGIPERFLENAASLGLDRSRLELRGRAPHPIFINGYQDIDIALDPFPYSGGLTTCEALFMGVPVITLAGDFFAARHSVSHLSNVGLEDCVTHTPEEYVDRAVAMARDVGMLAARRAGLRRQVLESPLCDAPRFGRNFGAALRFAWREHCRIAARA